MGPPAAPAPPAEARWERRAGRERRARLEAEHLLEAKSRELYEANLALSALTADLERRVADRTRELDLARERALILAEQDQLTGLPNRAYFNRVAPEAVARACREGARVGLLLVDVDGFKDINDTLGHAAGDAFLRGFAERFGALMPGGSFVARLGGDEFAAVVGGDGPGPGGPAATSASCPGSIHDQHAARRGAPVFAGALAALADAVLGAARRPVAHGGHLLRASCSVGIATYPDDADGIADLQRFADVALYRSKALGRARRTVFDATLRAEFEDRHALAADLKAAVGSSAIVPFFQPIVEAGTRRIAGVEVLARWRHPARGLLGPGTFIRLAEEQGLLGALFEHQLRAACAAVAPWIAAGLVAYVSINVSPSQFRSGDLPAKTFGILGRAGFDPAALMVEVTEDLLVYDFDRARGQLDELAAGGVRVALDDFGAGYSNIGYLRRLPIQTLKLDRMLTSDVCGDGKARIVLGAIGALARALDLKLVAEGVETAEQARWLSDLGCDLLQGYLFGRPMSAEAFVAGHGAPAPRGPPTALSGCGP